ncbi:hypothetical protein OID55_11035 [Streptomyces sp. NBC_00715]|uniref:hypothetical protein n=1 Tax=Streptomyces sp. NBC_00715 TaxID=2975811 RepID=UPI00386BA1B3
MKTYADIIDLLNHEGPGLQDYVTREELDQLLDGTLPHGLIADRYLDDLKHTDVVRVTADPAATRADLLTWIDWELDVAAQQRAEDAADDALAQLRAHVAAQALQERVALSGRDALIVRAKENGATKDAIAKSLGISRPTLDKWITERDDRILFNEAIYLMSRADMPTREQRMMFEALGIRDTSAQASVVLIAVEVGSTEQFTDEQRELIARAEKRARQVA